MGGSYQSAAEGLSVGSSPGASSGAPNPGVFALGAPARSASPGGAFGAPAPSKPTLSEPAHSGPGDAKSKSTAAPTLDSTRPDQMAAIRARKAEQEREQAARDKAARAREAAAEQAAERQREDRLKAMARRTAGRGAAATPVQGPAASDALIPQGDTVDARIRSLMRDPRYWKDRDPGLLDHVTRQWARAYPGTSLHTGFKRPDPQPAIRPEAVEPWPPRDETPEIQKLPARPDDHPPHPRPAVVTPGWTWNGWTGEWERMTPEEAAGEQAWLGRAPIPLIADAPTPASHAPTLGHNSGLTREDALAALRAEAADGSMSPSAFLKEAERIRQAHPDDGADGVRVQVADASGSAPPPQPAPASDDESRFPWKLATRETGRPSTRDPSTGKDVGWPSKRFDANRKIVVLIDPRTGEPVRDPDGYPYSTASDSQQRMRERVKDIITIPSDQRTREQHAILHEATTVRQLLFNGPPDVEGAPDGEFGGLTADDEQRSSPPRRPGSPTDEDDDLDMDIHTPEETPEGPRTPPPLIPLPDERRKGEQSPGGRPVPSPGAPGRRRLLRMQLRLLLQELGLLEGAESELKRAPERERRAR